MPDFRLNDRSRKFVREVGSIVLGVLIALGIGEVADAIRHRINAQRVLAAVRADIMDNTSTLEVRALGERCIRNRLASLSNELDRTRRTGRLRDIGEIGMSPTRSFRVGNWESALGNGDSLYMDKDVAAELADYFDSLRSFRQMREEAALDWARLSVLVHAPGAIDENTLSAARTTLAELAFRTKKIELLAGLLFEHHKQMGVPVRYLPFNGRPRSREQVIEQVRKAPICQPLIVVGETGDQSD